MSSFVGLLLINVFFVTGADAAACYDDRVDECNCNSVSCTRETCEDDMGGNWTDNCPFSCDPENCDPLAPSPDDPVCTGPPEAIDRFGKKLYRRKLIARDKPQDDSEGTFCHVTFDLCEGESQITHGIDTGYGDYYRIAATREWYNYTGTLEYSYSGMADPEDARSYSPVTPLSENTVQFIIKKALSAYEPDDGSCTPGTDCQFGTSALVCEVPIGSYFLISVVPDQANVESTHYVSVPNFDMTPGSGPYTINVIGQGVALTELNIAAMSELLQPFASDSSFTTIKTVNYLWANSYWSNSAWVWNETDSNDLARQFAREAGKYGIRFNLMHAISREERPEAEFPRINSTVIGDAFNLKNKTDQDQNIKWWVVGAKGFKKSIYPQVLSYGFDMKPCSDAAASKGYPYCGTNSLYEQLERGADPNTRERSDIFKFYEE